MYVEMVCKHYM